MTRVDSVEFGVDKRNPSAVVIHPEGSFGYVGTTATDPSFVVKVDLKSMERIGALTLPLDEEALQTAVIDPEGVFASSAPIPTPDGSSRWKWGSRHLSRLSALARNFGDVCQAACVAWWGWLVRARRAWRSFLVNFHSNGVATCW